MQTHLTDVYVARERVPCTIVTPVGSNPEEKRRMRQERVCVMSGNIDQQTLKRIL